MLVRQATFQECERLFRKDVERRGDRFNRYKKRLFPQAGFTHIQGKVATSGTASALSVVLTTNPVLGNLVCVALTVSTNAISALSVSDANSNVYTVTSKSPSTFQTGAGAVWLAYLLSAPANASKTINLSWTTADGSPTVWADEFSVSSGTASFENDAIANTGTAGTTINTPAITPSVTGELLYSGAAAGGTITSPIAGGTNAPWTGAAGAITNGDMAEYILSSGNTSTPVKYTQASGTWSAMVMAFKFTSSAVPAATSLSQKLSYGSDGMSPAF